MVRCASCEEWFELSDRRDRDLRRLGREPVCFECRNPLREPDEREREALRRWWLRRYPLEELLVLGRELAA
jgi:hypothetical protein